MREEMTMHSIQYSFVKCNNQSYHPKKRAVLSIYQFYWQLSTICPPTVNNLFCYKSNILKEEKRENLKQKQTKNL